MGMGGMGGLVMIEIIAMRVVTMRVVVMPTRGVAVTSVGVTLISAVTAMTMTSTVTVALFMAVATAVTVAMVLATAEKPRAYDVDRQPDHRDGNRFVERNAHWVDEALDRFVADQQCNDCQHNGAGNPARSPSFPVPNTNRLSVAWRRAYV